MSKLLKPVELELADDFRHLMAKAKHKNFPYYKSWRVWCNGICFGSIIKLTEKQKDGTSNFVISFHKDLGWTTAYIKNKKTGKYEFQRDWVDPRITRGFKTLKAAKKAFIEQWEKDLRRLLR
jgi:hypothetical protein